MLGEHTVGMMTLKVCFVASDEDEATPSHTIAAPMDFPPWNHASNPDDRSSCKSLKLCALYLLFRFSVELESTQVKMALPTLPGEREDLLLVMRTEKKTPKKQLALQKS